jgi:hypothetical protein
MGSERMAEGEVVSIESSIAVRIRVLMVKDERNKRNIGKIYLACTSRFELIKPIDQDEAFKRYLNGTMNEEEYTAFRRGRG